MYRAAGWADQRELDAAEGIELDFLCGEPRRHGFPASRAADHDLRHRRLPSLDGSDHRYGNKRHHQRHPILKMEAEHGKLGHEPIPHKDI